MNLQTLTLGWMMFVLCVTVVKLSSRNQHSEKTGTEKRYSKETSERLDLVRLKREAEQAATKFDLPNPTIEKFDAFLAAEAAKEQAVIDKIEQEYEASLTQDFVSRLAGVMTNTQEPITQNGHGVESLPPWPPRTMEYEITGDDVVIGRYHVSQEPLKVKPGPR